MMVARLVLAALMFWFFAGAAKLLVDRGRGGIVYPIALCFNKVSLVGLFASILWLIGLAVGWLLKVGGLT